MAEAVAALGVFVNVLSVAQFVWQILEKSNEFGQDGKNALKDNFVLDKCSKDLYRRNKRLQESLKQSALLPPEERDKDEVALNELALECNKEAGQLLKTLEDLESKDKSSRYHNVRAALRSAWKREEVDDMVKRMKYYEDQMQNRLMLSMSLKQKLQSEDIQKILARDKDMVDGLQQVQQNQKQAASVQGAQYQALVQMMAPVVDHVTALSQSRSPAHVGDAPVGSPGGEPPLKDDTKQKLTQLIKDKQLGPIKELLAQRPALAALPLEQDERTALHFAAEMGSLGIVKLLLNKTAPVDARDEDHSTPLHLAVKVEAPECVRLLLMRGANKDAEDDNSRTPIAYAAPFQECAWILNYGPDREAKDNDGETALMRFIRRRNVPVIKSLIRQGARHTYQTSKNGERTPLVYASEQGYEDIVKLLLEAGADVNFQTSFKDSPLSIAARHGHLEVVRLLLDHGANVSSENVGAETPLLEACNNGHDAIGELLVQRGAPVETLLKKGGQTAIHQAAKNGCVKIVAAILAINPLYINLRTESGWRPIDECVWWGQEAVVDLVLDHGPDLRWFGNHLGRTPLVLAASAGFDKVIRLLVKKGGVDLEATGADGKTALIYAIEQKHYNAARELLALGADPNHMEDMRGGWLPLSFAINTGNHEMLRLLLNEGRADPNRWNDGIACTPLVEAARRNFVTMAEDLLEAGANPNLHAADPRLDRGRHYPPICFAAMEAPRKGLDMLVLLVEKGKADLSLSNATHKWTPLHEVACHGPLSAVKYLLAHGADPDAIGVDPKNGEEIKPLDLALQERRGQIASELRQAMKEMVGTSAAQKEGAEGWHVVERHEREQAAANH
ncbi:MAG: hypothetical protein Q9159_006024 [Coniocarpon cinnabarinum]